MCRYSTGLFFKKIPSLKKQQPTCKKTEPLHSLSLDGLKSTFRLFRRSWLSRRASCFATCTISGTRRPPACSGNGRPTQQPPRSQTW
jgi:hypothetical protein